MVKDLEDFFNYYKLAIINLKLSFYWKYLSKKRIQHMALA